MTADAGNLHFDSKHRWLNDGRWHDLIVILDDATSVIYYAQPVEEESTRTGAPLYKPRPSALEKQRGA